MGLDMRSLVTWGYSEDVLLLLIDTLSYKFSTSHVISHNAFDFSHVHTQLYKDIKNSP